MRRNLFFLLCLILGAASLNPYTRDRTPTAEQITADQRRRISALAKSHIGKPYIFGASGPGTFDCSGLSWYVARQAGRPIPRDMRGQWWTLGKVKKPETGDLVFFVTYGRDISHVGIYVGDGKFVNAPLPGYSVRVDNLTDPYWAARYAGAKSILSTNPPSNKK